MIKAILFDMDGLMYDTERLFLIKYKEAARELGVEISDEVTLSLQGMPWQKSDEVLKEAYPDLDTAKCREIYEIKTKEYVAVHGNPEKPGLQEAVRMLKNARLKLAVVSGSYENTVRGYLKLSGIEESFDVIVGGDRGLPGKPAPDGFLAAAGELGVDIRDCAVLEDALPGLKGARQAGTFNILIPDLKPYSELFAPYVDAVCKDLKQAAEVILCR